MIRKITLLSFLFLCSFTFAQYGQGQVGHLTLFSEDGDKFFLVLNGESQNDIPQTNLRIEDLNQPYYNVKIQFLDKTLMEISKNSLMIADADGVFQDVTYKIKRDKNNKGKMKINFFSMIPVRQGYLAPSNVYVMHYGQPREIRMQNPQGGVRQTTTTTTTQTGGNNIGVGVNVGGINMGVSINDNMGGSVVTQTTTTTNTNGNHGSNNNHGSTNAHISSNNNYGNNSMHDDRDVIRGCGGRYCMSPNDFNDALATLKKLSFEDSRLKTAKQIVSANCLNVNQILQIAKSFSFEDNTLDFAKFAYDYCTEPKSYFKLNGIFNFSSNADELSEYVQNRN